ncbi:MAG: DUF167 domain-containing protein [Bacteroidota bacterium]
MKIRVKVKPNAHKNEVEKLPDGSYIVRVTSPPVEGRANEKLIEVLAEYFQRPKRAIRILVGKSGKHKIIEIQ